MNVVTLDFETFYDKDYTLSGKMNTSEYVRDPRFHAHGMSIKIGTNKTKWVTRDKIRKTLDAIDWSKTAVLCHNTAFDGFVLYTHYGIVPAFYLDTLSMSRACFGHHVRHDLDSLAKRLGLAGKVKKAALVNTKGKQLLTKQEEKDLGAYAIDDSDDCFHSFWKLVDHVSDDELELIHITLNMFCNPVLKVDIPRVEAELQKEVGRKAAALLASGASVESLMSNDKFANLLKAAGAKLPMKISPSTGQPTYAFAKSDLEFQKLMATGNDKVKALCEARLRVKSTIGETRAVRFLEAGKDGQCLPILLLYSGAHTHRWSGGNKMNLQNLQRGGELRRSILAPAGHVICVADSAQIEARVLAWLAKQMDVVNAFAGKKDVYKMMASAIYGKPVEEITKDERFIGKICVLGLGYGMGPAKLQHTLEQGTMGPPVKIDFEECRRIVNIYRSKNDMIKKFWDRMTTVITCMLTGVEGKVGPLEYGKGYIRLPNGMFLQYHGLHGEVEATHGDLVSTEVSYLTRTGRSKLYGGLLTENLVQALARIVVAQQMLTIHRAGIRVVSMTHDEIITICKKEDAEKVMAFMFDTMRTPPDWCADLPLDADGGYDVCYSK